MDTTSADQNISETSDQPDARELRVGFRTLSIVFVLLVLVASVIIRFYTKSQMWLDEAQTFNIAQEPLSKLIHYLREDGSPPLYYFLSHIWNSIFGTSNLAARSLAGVISVITLPIAWIVGNKVGGKQVAFAGLIIFGTSPYLATYATTERMYSLLTLEGLLALWLTLLLRESPTLINAGLFALVIASLEYTHYWSFFLIGALGVLFLYDAIRYHTKVWLYGLGAMAAGSLTFLPWLSEFLFQRAHTGTPWAQTVSVSAISSTVGQFAGGVTQPNTGGDFLKILYLLLVALALFGYAKNSRTIELDLRTRPGVRQYALIFILTLLLGITASSLFGVGFQTRYAAEAFPFFGICIAYAFKTLRSGHIRRIALGLTAILGLVASVPNISQNRTQASQVASVIEHNYQAGDVVAYCPDQLGPDGSRMLKGLDLKMFAFPRGNSPQIVNWIDYLEAIKRSSPGKFVQKLLNSAGPTHTIWYDWMPNYKGFGSDCAAIADALYLARGKQLARLSPSPLVYEPSYLLEFPKLQTP